MFKFPKFYKESKLTNTNSKLIGQKLEYALKRLSYYL